MSGSGDPEIPPLPLNEISGDDIQSRSRSEMRLYLNEISGDDIKSRSEIEMRRSTIAQIVLFWGFQNLCHSLRKQQSAPSEITKVISLIKPVVFGEFVARLASKCAKGTHPSSTSLM